MNAPLYFRWYDDYAMHPLPRHLPLARKQFELGKVYRLEVIEERSGSAHRRYFAAVREAWMQLPEAKAETYPTPDHLRRWALIKTGYHDERAIACGSEAEAVKVASFIKPMDSFAVVTLKGDVVKVYTAKSQSMRRMDKDTFQKSSQAVLDCLSEVIGVKRSELEKEGERGANT